MLLGIHQNLFVSMFCLLKECSGLHCSESHVSIKEILKHLCALYFLLFYKGAFYEVSN